MLAGVLVDHEGALRASLAAAYPGLPTLRNILARRADLTFFELADLAVNLPRGCALWRSVGGPLAWTDETQMLALVEYRAHLLAWVQSKDGQEGRNRPEPPEPPPYAYEVEAENRRAAEKRAAFIRNHGPREVT